jgi:hypothetical protein
MDDLHHQPPVRISGNPDWVPLVAQELRFPIRKHSQVPRVFDRKRQAKRMDEVFAAQTAGVRFAMR